MTVHATQRPRRPLTRCLVAAAFALGALPIAGPASATGMQGHIYMAQCAAEQTANARLRAVFAAHPVELANGGFFPDSGYTAADHDQGEIAHWEQYVEGYIQTIRERYPSADDAEAAPHVALLMGLAAHGITDSTFDTLLYARANEIEPDETGSFDMAMDIFLVNDRPRYHVPEFAYDAKTLSDVYVDKIPHAVSPEAIEGAMSTARSGIAVVANLLYKGADDYGKKFPWGRAAFLDPRTPGGYPFGAKITAGYYEQILRRLDGDVSADEILIGRYPDASYPLATLDRARADGKIVLFFGHGLDRASIDADTVTLADGKGAIVPTKLDIFRGDQWPNVLIVAPLSDWQPNTTYTVTLSKNVRTLYGTSPSKNVVLEFTTCTPASAGADCPAVMGEPPPSACPLLDAAYTARPGALDEEEEPPPSNQPPPAKQDETAGGCAMAQPYKTLPALLPGVAVAAFAARRLRRRSHR